MNILVCTLHTEKERKNVGMYICMREIRGTWASMGTCEEKKLKTKMKLRNCHSFTWHIKVLKPFLLKSTEGLMNIHHYIY